jgi:hypothetical protein
MSEPEFPGRSASESTPAPPASGPWATPAPPADPWASAPPSPPASTAPAQPLGEDGAWPSAPTPAPPGRRPASIVAAVVALALIAGAATYFLLRSEPAGTGTATPLALAFDRGDETTYDIHITMDGSVDLGTLGEQPLNVDMGESVGWKVLRVTDAGVATIRVTVDKMWGSANGQPIPGTVDGQSMTLRMTRDGQILDANGLAFGSTGGGLGSFPGMDQVTPILPDHEVAPGDEWDKHFSQSFPFGDGKIEYTAHSTFDRYETVNGVHAAVVTTSYTVPLDFSINLSDLAKAFGGSSGGQLSGLGGQNATIDYGGSGTFTQTSWLDLAARQIVKSESNGDFDMTMSFPGLQEQLGSDQFGMSATFSMELTRR